MKPRPQSDTDRHARPRLAIALLAWLLALAWAPRAAAAPPADSALAETLFQEAKKLMADHRYAEACPKLAASQHLDPASGTLLRLALCHEAEGKLATAWAEFNDARTMALKEDKADRASIAKAHAEALEPALPRLIIRVGAAAKVEGLTVRLDTLAHPAAAWGVAIPVDPGAHEIAASAAGKLPFVRRVDIEGKGVVIEVEISALDDPPPPPRPPVAPPPEPPRPTPPAPRGVDAPTIAGFVCLGVGGVGAVTGTIAGVRAISLQSSANKVCPSTSCSDANAVRDNHAAGTLADVATASFVIGGAAAVASLVLLVGPRPVPAQAAPAVSWRPRITVGPGYARLTGSF